MTSLRVPAMTNSGRHTTRLKHVLIWNPVVYLLISLISSFDKKEFKQKLH
jgi:hypothetical protein